MFDYEQLAFDAIALLTSIPRELTDGDAVRLMSIKVQLPLGSDADQVAKQIESMRPDLKAHSKGTENGHLVVALGYKA